MHCGLVYGERLEGICDQFEKHNYTYFCRRNLVIWPYVRWCDENPHGNKTST